MVPAFICGIRSCRGDFPIDQMDIAHREVFLVICMVSRQYIGGANCVLSSSVIPVSVFKVGVGSQGAQVEINSSCFGPYRSPRLAIGFVLRSRIGIKAIGSF